MTNLSFLIAENLQIVQKRMFTDLSITHIYCPKLESVDGEYMDGGFEETEISNLNLPLLTQVSHYGFNRCQIKKLTLPQLSKVGYFSFANCTFKVIYLKSLRETGNYCFSRCCNLKIAILPSLNILGAGAFCDCNKLKEVRIPFLEEAGEAPFYCCKRLQKVVCFNLKKFTCKSWCRSCPVCLGRMENVLAVGKIYFLSRKQKTNIIKVKLMMKILKK